MTAMPEHEASVRKAQVAATFDSLADDYDEMQFTKRTARRLVELADLTSGEHVLDIATGTGWAALAAAEQVGASGHVLGIDLAERILEQARRKVAAAGCPNVEFRVGDAEHLDLPDGNVDVVLCASGIFFLPDPLRALREWRRVTRPGGRVAFSAFGAGMMGALNRRFAAHLARAGLPPLPIPPLLPAGHWGDLLAEAGYGAITMAEEQMGYMLPDAQAWWLETQGGLHRLSLQQLGPDELATFRTRYLADVSALVGQEGLWVDIPAIFVVGVVP